MHVMVAGDRTWLDKRAVTTVTLRMASLPADTQVYLRSLEGVGEIAAFAARELHLTCLPAEDGNSRQCLLDNGIELVLAFHRNIRYSKRTQALVAAARKLNLEVEVHDGNT